MRIAPRQHRIISLVAVFGHVSSQIRSIHDGAVSFHQYMCRNVKSSCMKFSSTFVRVQGNDWDVSRFRSPELEIRFVYYSFIPVCDICTNSENAESFSESAKINSVLKEKLLLSWLTIRLFRLTLPEMTGPLCFTMFGKINFQEPSIPACMHVSEDDRQRPNKLESIRLAPAPSASLSKKIFGRLGRDQLWPHRVITNLVWPDWSVCWFLVCVNLVVCCSQGVSGLLRVCGVCADV